MTNPLGEDDIDFPEGYIYHNLQQDCKSIFATSTQLPWAKKKRKRRKMRDDEVVIEWASFFRKRKKRGAFFVIIKNFCFLHLRGMQFGCQVKIWNFEIIMAHYDKR